MNKPKILILLTSLRRCGPVLGGVALAKHLDSSQWEVTVGSLADRGPDTETVIDDLNRCGIRFEIFDLPGWIDLIRMGKIKLYLQRERIELVISYGLRPDIINALMTGESIRVASIRGMLRQEYRHKYGVVVSKLFSALHRRMLLRMHRVVAISKAMRNYLAEEGIVSEKIEYIPNFVDLSGIKQSHGSISKSDQDITIGFVGNFVRSKRVDWIIRAFDALRQRHPDLPLKLELVGKGPFFHKMKELTRKLNLENHVSFHGYVIDVFQYMENMDLMVMASKTEGIPRTLMEAMALGKTCIGSSVDGITELIIDGKTGYLFDASDFNALVDLLDFVVGEKKYLNPITVRKHIENNFSAEFGAEATADLFRRLLD
jgi:glycosyltransferase involved in cell wall biosynthesis